jgi:hypothetical protein
MQSVMLFLIPGVAGIVGSRMREIATGSVAARLQSPGQPGISETADSVDYVRNYAGSIANAANQGQSR